MELAIEHMAGKEAIELVRMNEAASLDLENWLRFSYRLYQIRQVAYRPLA